MNPAYFRNSGANAHAQTCGLASATAAGAGDATAVTGATVDRQGYESAKVVISYKTTLTAAKTLSIAAEYQESADGSTWDTAVALQASTVEKTGAVTDGLGEVVFNVDLSGKKRYFRVNFTPDLSHTSTDTAILSATIILGGASAAPVAAE